MQSSTCSLTQHHRSAFAGVSVTPHALNFGDAMAAMAKRRLVRSGMESYLIILGGILSRFLARVPGVS